MAKVVIVESGVSVPGIFGDPYERVASDKSTITFDEVGGEATLQAVGKFTLSFNGRPKSGRIEEFSYFSSDGETLMVSISGLNLSAVNAHKHLVQGTFSDILGRVFSGNDTIIGGDGSDPQLYGYAGNDRINGKGGFDYITGGEGNDRMTGGEGSDVFVFHSHSGFDVITDFNADNESEDRDYFSGRRADVKFVKQDGDDTIVVFYGGDRVTLLGVDKRDFSSDDYWTEI